MRNIRKILVAVLCGVCFCACASQNDKEVWQQKDTIEQWREKESETKKENQSLTSAHNITVIPLTTATLLPTVMPMPTAPLLPDTEAPVITLTEGEYLEVIARTEFTEPGYTAEDDRDGMLTEQVCVTGEVDVNRCDTYTLMYEVTDTAGNQTSVQRTVVVKQPEEIIPEGKVVYLTFDDGPGKYTEELLEILERHNVKATFFTCGNGKPDLVTKIYEAGHTVGIHCRNHDYKVVYTSEEVYFEDLFAMQDLIYECTGIRTTLVRFPGGSSNTSSSYNPGIMTRLTQELELQGFQYFDWNVSSSDVNTKDTAEILENMKKGIQERDCSIVLQHAETRESSVAAVEDLIVWALENGYTFMQLDATSPKSHHRIFN